ncbi:hypothetical protein MJO29_016415 [Puccinia striiformis f. sp. tritici]|uniref:Uncharacterized protein n=1 Tax=Puccinia striiformis f. sp. tritici PST-78 TaxID=1165861 RepID=A0A0L0VZP6_9BASI|nr:hypothetical protein Pst134EB_031192 [Puccinia striiformis f. sp. tritici]KAI7935152.1 hypothetical protein MJO29_016415 [Puccinia striiformis f. sp. tritici]KNF04756.1 hypothetical protein PSTG_02236 [Puccinia striiformis f. sp. tritici PST-78]
MIHVRYKTTFHGIGSKGCSESGPPPSALPPGLNPVISQMFRIKVLAIFACSVMLLNGWAAMPPFKRERPPLESRLVTFGHDPLDIPSGTNLGDPNIIKAEWARPQVTELDGNQVLKSLLIRDVESGNRAFLHIEGLAEGTETQYAIWLPSACPFWMRAPGIPHGIVHRITFDELRSHESPVIQVTGSTFINRSTTGNSPVKEIPSSKENPLVEKLYLTIFSDLKVPKFRGQKTDTSMLTSSGAACVSKIVENPDPPTLLDGISHSSPGC